jgi:diguanylate cyclase (GGDEF)-like protein
MQPTKPLAEPAAPWRRLVGFSPGIALDIALALAGVVAVLYQPGLVPIELAVLLVLQVIRCAQLRHRMTRSARQTAEAVAENKLLVESIQCAPLGFALYDPDDRLMVWNSTYESFYPKAFAAFHAQLGQPNPRYADLLRETVPEHLSAQEIDEYIALRVADQRQASGVPIDRHYPQAGWRRVTKFLTPSGAIAGFAVDISESKRTEVELQAEITRRRETELELQRLARTDSLTSALNRRAFMEKVDSEIARFLRYGTPASVIVLDVDWFKSINDKFGHQAGDAALVEVVNVCMAQIRQDVDHFGRIGGEEFCVLLPNTEAEQAVHLAQRIRCSIEAVRIEVAPAPAFSVTASFGVSGLHAGNARLTTLIGEADRAMYVSKMEGRNRVTAFVNGITPDATRALEAPPSPAHGAQATEPLPH